MQNTAVSDVSSWGADFFGGLNEMPAEAVGGLEQILEAMGSEPGFHAARRALLQDLDLRPGSSVLDAGCGIGVSLPDILDAIGASGLVHGIDPTLAFVESARRRAQAAGAANAVYDVGDIRAIPTADARFDATFCEKILIHAGPPAAALGEMVRVTRAGGRVGALEWLPYFALSSTRPDLVARFNGVFRQAVYDHDVSANLRRHFLQAGLTDLHTRAFVAHTTSIDAHPFWRAFLVAQMPMFAHAGLIEAEEADALVADIEALNRQGAFSASFIIQTTAGTKGA